MRTETIKLLAAFAVVTMALMASPASGQQVPPAASCTTSLLTSFTPCFNFLTNGTAAPTTDCCRSLAALVNASTGCACLILTGNVPLGGVPINRTLAVTLPRTCNSMSNVPVPLQCRDTSAQIPAPGPVAVAPSMPPLPPASPDEPAATAPVRQGQTRPAMLPSSAWRTSSHVSATAAFMLLLAAAAALV